MNNSNSNDHYNSDNDFLNDAGFINFHFKLNARDEFYWNNWIKNHPEKIELINEARGVLNMLSFTLPDDEYNTELEKIKQAIGVRQNAKTGNRVFKLLQWNSSTGKSRKILAAIVVVLIVSGFFLYNFFASGSDELKEQYNDTKNNIVVTLEDNSKVALSPGSRLKYRAFNPNQRDVYLEGNAGFEVIKNTNAPFKVYTGKIVATVLGTSFDIINNSEDSSVSVEIKTGKLKVAVINENGLIAEEMMLAPHQHAVFINQHLLLVSENLRHDVAFSKNDYVQIAGIMRKIFGIVLINESNNADWKFTGQFKNSTAQEIIESICLIKGLTSTTKGDTVYIR